MAGMDLGKQVGPLPLGAWIVVVGAGLGVALWTRKKEDAPEIVESGNGTPGVGAGGSGQYTELVPVTGGSGQITKPTTNEEWGVLAINWLIAHNYPANVADSAVRKYLAGVKLSVGEYTMIGLVLAALGAPPQVLPPAEEQDPPVVTPPPTTDPPPATDPPATTLAKVTGLWTINIWTFAIELHWKSVKGATGYQIRMEPGGIDASNWVGTGKMIAGVQPGQTYKLYVAAKKSGQTGPESDPLSVRVPTAGEGGHPS